MIHLYRHFNSKNELLYVGISLSAVHRLEQHKRTAHWFEDLKRVEIERFSSRIEAMDAEKRALETEQPKYNIQLKAKRKAKQPQICREYLTDRDFNRFLTHLRYGGNE
jgi:excinuclease UvrABC nuclease subunit